MRNVVIPGEPCQEHQNGVENAENVNVNGTAVANRGEPEEVSLFLAESIAASPTLAVSSRGDIFGQHLIFFSNLIIFKNTFCQKLATNYTVYFKIFRYVNYLRSDVVEEILSGGRYLS